MKKQTKPKQQETKKQTAWEKLCEQMAQKITESKERRR